MNKIPIQTKVKSKNKQGFTLIETLVAISVLTVAVAAPLTLAAQSLLFAFAARDQVTAFHLAQEAVETVRAQRDHNLLSIIKTGSTISWLSELEVYVQAPADSEKPFMVDSLSVNSNFIACSGSTLDSCDYLQFNDITGFYGHEDGDPSRFRRTVQLIEVPDSNGEEVTVHVEVSWYAGRFGRERTVVVEENLFEWIAGITG